MFEGFQNIIVVFIRAFAIGTRTWTLYMRANMDETEDQLLYSCDIQL